MIRVLRRASYNIGSADVIATLHIVLQGAPQWVTGEMRETIPGLNLTLWTDADVLAATGAITPTAYDALRAVPADPTPVEP